MQMEPGGEVAYRVIIWEETLGGNSPVRLL